jgi:hypothetical protein
MNKIEFGPFTFDVFSLAVLALAVGIVLTRYYYGV